MFQLDKEVTFITGLTPIGDGLLPVWLHCAHLMMIAGASIQELEAAESALGVKLPWEVRRAALCSVGCVVQDVQCAAARACYCPGLP